MKIPNPWKWLTRISQDYLDNLPEGLGLGIGIGSIIGAFAVALYHFWFDTAKEPTMIMMLFIIIVLQMMVLGKRES